MPYASKYRFRWGRYCIVVENADNGLVDTVASYLSLEKPDRVDALSPDLIVSEARGFFRVNAARQTLEYASKEDLLIGLTTLISAEFCNKASDQALLHAGAIVNDEQAILFSGAAYSGKSTLALNALQQGATVVGDDWLLYEPNTAVVQAVPKAIKPRMTRAEAKEAIRTMPAINTTFGLLNGETRLMVSRGKGFFNDYASSLPIRLLAFIERGGKTAIHSISKPEALKMILEQTIINERRLHLQGVRLLNALQHDRQVCRLVIGKNDSANALKMLLAL